MAERDLSGVSFIRALIPFMRAPPSWPNCLPKAHLPIPSELQRMNLGEGDTNIESIAFSLHAPCPTWRKTHTLTMNFYLFIFYVCIFLFIYIYIYIYIFWCGPFFKAFTEFVTVLLLLYVLFFSGCEACGILAPWSGIEPALPALEGEVLATEPPGKSLDHEFF